MRSSSFDALTKQRRCCSVCDETEALRWGDSKPQGEQVPQLTPAGLAAAPPLKESVCPEGARGCGEVGGTLLGLREAHVSREAQREGDQCGGSG